MVTVSALAAVTLLGCLLSAVIGWVGVVRRDVDVPGSRPLVVIFAGLVLWTGAYGVSLLTFDPTVSLLLEIPIWLGSELVTVSWVFFALAFTGRGGYLTRRNAVAISLVPAVTVLVVATGGVHDLFFRNYEVIETLGAAVRTFDRGPWVYVKSAYASLLITAGWLLFLEDLLEERTLYRDQSVAVILGSLVPFAAYTKWLLELGPYPHVDFTPPVLGITALLYGYAIFRAELFEATPAARRIGRRAALDNFADAVVILDDDGRITALNAPATELLGCESTEDALSRRIDDQLDAPLDLSRRVQEVTVETAEGWREFEIKSTPTTDQNGRTVGYTVVFHDVTRRERRKQRLTVLNRILRHNLRNRLTALDGYATRLAERTDGRDGELAAQLVAQTDDLADLTEQAREIQKLLERGETDSITVDLGRLLDGVVEDVASDYPERTFRVNAAGAPAVETDRELLTVVVRNLVENAADHGDGAVRVTATTVNDRVRIVVSDGGPGVPDHERAAVMEGEETPLRHGSGLGLWVVKWGTSRLGGQFELADNDRGGTDARIELPIESGRTVPERERAPAD